MMSVKEVRRVAKRVSDTDGVVRRGGMLAAPAFGEHAGPDRGDLQRKNPAGARWVIHEGNAMLLREMYRMRRAGLAHVRIARWLNEKGVPSPRCARDGGPSSWRQASVQRVLANPIYRGVLLYNGSGTHARLRREFNRAPGVSEHDREHLRLVDDETWFACNPPPRQQLRSGVKHPLVGLLRCGDCGCKLSLKFRKDGVGGLHTPPASTPSVREPRKAGWATPRWAPRRPRCEPRFNSLHSGRHGDVQGPLAGTPGSPGRNRRGRGRRACAAAQEQATKAATTRSKPEYRGRGHRGISGRGHDRSQAGITCNAGFV